MRSLCLFLILPILLFGCSKKKDEPKTEDKSQAVHSSKPEDSLIPQSPPTLEERDGLTYLVAEDGTSDQLYSGDSSRYYTNGQLKTTGTYSDGRLHGYYEWYYDNGQIERRGTYQDGSPHGVWEYYDRDGRLKRKATY